MGEIAEKQFTAFYDEVTIQLKKLDNVVLSNAKLINECESKIVLMIRELAVKL